MCETFANSMAKGKRKRARKQANTRRIQANKAQSRDSSGGATPPADSMAVTPVSALAAEKTPTSQLDDVPREQMEATPAQLDCFADEIKSVWTDAGYEDPSPAPPSVRPDSESNSATEGPKLDDSDDEQEDDSLALPLARGNSRQGLWLGLGAAGIAIAVGSQVFGLGTTTEPTASVSQATTAPESSATAVVRRSPLRSDPDPEAPTADDPAASEDSLSEDSPTPDETATKKTSPSGSARPRAARASKQRAPAGDTALLLERAQIALRAGAVKRAATLYRQILAGDPGNRQATTALSQLPTEHAPHSRGIFYDNALGKYPEYWSELGQQADARWNAGDHAGAVPLYRRIVSNAPGTAHGNHAAIRIAQFNTRRPGPPMRAVPRRTAPPTRSF